MSVAVVVIEQTKKKTEKQCEIEKYQDLFILNTLKDEMMTMKRKKKKKKFHLINK